MWGFSCGFCFILDATLCVIGAGRRLFWWRQLQLTGHDQHKEARLHVPKHGHLKSEERIASTSFGYKFWEKSSWITNYSHTPKLYSHLKNWQIAWTLYQTLYSIRRNFLDAEKHQLQAIQRWIWMNDFLIEEIRLQKSIPSDFVMKSLGNFQ